MNTQVSPKQVAQYYLNRTYFDGELISPLKMQKMVYYAYVWNLVKNKNKLFDEKIEAWPAGPVIPSLYHDLKKYEASPIGKEFCDIDVAKFRKNTDHNVLNILDEVYEKYISLSAFELVELTHSELPWKNARKGLSETDQGSKHIISEADIFKAYSPIHG